MRRLMSSCLLFAAAVLVSQLGFAVEVTGLYEAEVPVADQRAASRSEAARAALAEVLVKVTGNPAAAGQPQFQPLLQQAEQWLQRYQYRATPGAAVPQTLVASFDRQAINRRIYDAGLPVWGQNRPRVVVWLLMESNGGRSLVGGELRPDLQALVGARAERRGLPVVFPQMSAPEQTTAMSVQSIDALALASQPYQADAVLLGRIYTAGSGRWQGQWTFRHAGHTSSWDGGEGSVADVLAAGIDAVASDLARRYALALKPGVTGATRLAVTQVDKVQDYARVSRYLGSLDAVSAVAVESVEGNTVVYRLQIRGELQSFTQLLAMGKVLAASPGGVPPSGQLDYQLMP